MVQEYVLSELDSGERLITEKVPTVRSVALGFWIGTGSRDARATHAALQPQEVLDVPADEVPVAAPGDRAHAQKIRRA